jgi:holliday junction DNA helicase RuvA
MIAYLRGSVADISAGSIILDVNGVGYLVQVPSSFRDRMILGSEQPVHVHTSVREDDISLYGFPDMLHRETFERLCSVNKVGPKLALAILSHFDLAGLSHAVQRKDLASLSKVPGIGKRTAERLCLELQGKLPGPYGAESPEQTSKGAKAKRDPLQLALAQLDYRKSEIDAALHSGEVPGAEEAPVEERLRASLRFLAKQS